MLALIPGERIQNLTVENRCLKTSHGGWVAKRCVAWNRESREGRIGHAFQANLPGKVLACSRPGVVEFPAQISEANVVGQRRTEDVCVGAEDALYTNISDVAQRISLRDAIGTAVIGIAIVDVVACRQ